MAPEHFEISKILSEKLEDTKEIVNCSVYQSLTGQERNWRKYPIRFLLKIHKNKLNQEYEFLLQ